MSIKNSELIIRPDGSVYHLGLYPEQVAPLIITVGDPDRVDQVAAHFDTIDYTQHIREFKTVGGTLAGNKIICISTGIGTDNVDIVINELDALVNIDFKTKQVYEQQRSLTFLRLGTSGTFQSDIPVDTLLISQMAIGLDGLGPFYAFGEHELLDQFKREYPAFAAPAYFGKGSTDLQVPFLENGFVAGLTLTCAGFYGPQRRSLRLPFEGPSLAALAKFDYQGQRLTNFEMETAGIYGLCNLLGHRCLSVNAILANRQNGSFSDKANHTVSDMIEKAFSILRSQASLWWAN